MPTAELGCDINNIQLFEGGVRPTLRQRKIQCSLYLPAQLTSFVFTQGKRLPCAEARPKSAPAWLAPRALRAYANSIVKLKRREPARPSGLEGS